MNEWIDEKNVITVVVTMKKFEKRIIVLVIVAQTTMIRI